MSTEVNLVGFSRSVVAAGLLDEKKAAEAVVQARQNKTTLVNWLVQNKQASARALMELAAEQFGVAYLDLNAFDHEHISKELISEKIIRDNRILPLGKRGNSLFIAISDPSNQQAVSEVQFGTGSTVEMLLVEDDKLGALIDRLFDSTGSSLGNFDTDELGGGEAPDEAREDGDDPNDEDASPIVKYVNKMLLDAIKTGASDLHFEPYEKAYRVRYRTDGVLHEVHRPPKQHADRISARLKVMSEMDISERRKPQDGRIKLKVSKSKSIDFRVNTLPTLWGEKIVLRILDASSAQLGIDMLGYEPEQKQLYMDALNQPQGMILVTGPTGSGKTVSLYTGLNILNTVERNISTAEDPVEINLEGINQVNVNPKQGMDFNQALRAFLRQDPDVIMVGEIRDLETAEIAVKAAQTGHMVMSTLHTNSCAETLTRLRNMGLASFNLATSVNLIIAQRLARKLCKCKKELPVPEETLLKEGFSQEQIGTFKVYGPNGCDSCNAGYKGRVGVYEVVKITPAIQRIIMEEGNAIDIDNQMRAEGFNSLRESGLLKVMQGVTSLAEINRVTQD